MRIALDELGAGQFLEIRDPNRLSWGLQKKLSQVMSTDEDDVSSKVESAEILAIALIKAGNVLDWDGNPIVFPLTSVTVADLPAEALVAVVKEFGKLREGNDPK